jgi:hypothetical protein
MSDEEVRRFLAQFDKAQEAAHEAVATFPKLDTSPDQHKKE